MSITYSVILPTYNEFENLPVLVYLLHDAFKKISGGFEIIVIDDSSTDNTFEAAKKLQKIYGEKSIVGFGVVKSRPSKLGLGSAYIYGIKFCKGRYVIIMDSDLSHDPANILDFVRKQKEQDYDVVVGTRYAKGGAINGWNWMRELCSCTANVLASELLGLPFSDMTSSFRLYKREALQEIGQIASMGYSFQLEVLYRLVNAKYKIAEVPIKFVNRKYGESKIGINEIFGFVKCLAMCCSNQIK